MPFQRRGTQNDPEEGEEGTVSRMEPGEHPVI
jgi:hypothetical protein